MLAPFWRAAARIASRPAVTAWLIRRAQRTPYVHITGPDGSVYMERYWLFNAYPPESSGKRPWWEFPISIRLHRILRADKARVYIAAAFNWALHSANDYTTLARRDWGLDKNPAMSVARDQGAVKVRDRNLDGAEIKLLWDSMEDGTSGFSPAVAGCIRMMIGCGQRVHETLRLHGCEIDLQRAVWHMPAAKTKGKKRDHIIPLPAIVLPYLRTLKDNHGDGPLFPSRSDSKAEVIALVSMSQAVGRWCALNSEAITPFQTRDLRRTWKSRAHDAGVDRFTRDLIQQHAKSDTGSKNYDRADYLPQMREAMAKWSTWLEATVA